MISRFRDGPLFLLNNPLAERRVLQEIQLCYVGTFYVKANVLFYRNIIQNVIMLPKN